MKILKVFNNNCIVAIDDALQDIIVTGSGVGFQRKSGDLVDNRYIERIYVLQDKQKARFIQSLEKVPTLYYEITENIIRKASQELKADFDGTIFISISDHISFAVKRRKEGIYLPNVILNETKVLYKKEYEIGLWALKYIEDKTGILLDEDEAGYIALHLVNFSLNHKLNNATKIVALTKEVLEIINISMKIEIKSDTLAFARICTHLKYLSEKIFSKKENEIQDRTLDLRESLKTDLRLTLCINRISKLIFERYNYHLSPDEQTYLSIHIKRNIS